MFALGQRVKVVFCLNDKKKLVFGFKRRKNKISPASFERKLQLLHSAYFLVQFTKFQNIKLKLIFVWTYIKHPEILFILYTKLRFHFYRDHFTQSLSLLKLTFAQPISPKPAPIAYSHRPRKLPRNYET